MLLTVSLKNLSVIIDTIRESGMDIREITVVLKFIKNRNIMITTKIEPSISAFWILLIDA